MCIGQANPVQPGEMPDSDMLRLCGYRPRDARHGFPCPSLPPLVIKTWELGSKNLRTSPREDPRPVGSTTNRHFAFGKQEYLAPFLTTEQITGIKDQVRRTAPA
jgi:hypothetical protein